MRSLLLISIGANVLLAGWLVYLSSRSQPDHPEHQPQGLRTVAHFSADLAEDTKRMEAAKAEVKGSRSFDWKAITSDDPRVYCLNLRAMSCPEHIVRVIILAEVNRKFRKQFVPLLRRTGTNFWEKIAAGKTSRKVETEGEAEARSRMGAVDLARRSLLRELFGEDRDRLPRDSVHDDRDGKALFSFLPPERLAAALEWERRRDEAIMSVHRQHPRPSDHEVQLELVRAEFEDEGQRLLTSEEWQEYQARTSKFAYVPGMLYGVDLSADEMRALVRLRETHGENEKSPALQEEIKSLLGEQRFADFQRAQDDGFRALYRVALRLELPKEAAIEAYQMKQSFEQAAKQIRSNSEIPEMSRRSSLGALRAQAEAGLSRSLGQTGFETYQRNGGWWVRNLERLTED